MPVDEFRSFVDQLPIGVFRLDRELRTLYVNRRLAERIGVPAEGTDAARLQQSRLPTELRLRLLGAAQRIVDSGQPLELEFTLPGPPDERMICLRLAPETDAKGRVLHVTGVAIDITDRVRLEQALRRSEQRFKAFMDHTPTVAWIKDEAGRYLFANRYYETRFGFREGEWSGRTDFDLWPEEFARACREREEEVLTTRMARESVGPAPDRQGHVREWHLVRFPFEDPSGARYLGGIALDITEQRRLARKLRDNEERLRRLLDDSPVVVWIKDERRRYVYLSRSFERRFEMRVEDWIGHTDDEFWPEDQAARFRKSDHDVLEQQRSFESVETVDVGSDRRRSWWIFKYPFQDSAGAKFIGGVGVDITERHRAEEEVRLQSITDELTSLHNRRGFMLLAEQEYRVIQRTRRPCVLYFIDLDGLKDINDRHGHEQGDRALIATADALRATYRNIDILGRIGGDEFVVLAVDCSDPRPLDRRLRGAVRTWNRRGGAPFQLSLSVGHVPVRGDRAESFEAVLARADERMYARKRRRR